MAVMLHPSVVHTICAAIGTGPSAQDKSLRGITMHTHDHQESPFVLTSAPDTPAECATKFVPVMGDNRRAPVAVGDEPSILRNVCGAGPASHLGWACQPGGPGATSQSGTPSQGGIWVFARAASIALLPGPCQGALPVGGSAARDRRAIDMGATRCVACVLCRV